MIAAWILYALLVGALLALAAWLMEEGVRLRGGAVRFLWLGALLATVALAALAPLRATAPVSLTGAVLSRTEPGDAAAVARPDGPAAAAARVLETSRAALAGTLERAAELGEGAAGTALAAGWGLLTAAALGLGAATLLRSRRARRAWPRVELAGAPVRVAPRVGPAVLGIRRPEVVVPAWLLHAPPEEQRLVVMHEAEHVRARDPLTLAAGCVAVALMPWNPAAWWMLLRLRGAVEMDCDARVLRRGVERRAYGTLLIEMAGRGPGLSLGVPALVGSPSTLERRIRAMNARLPRFARLRATLLGVLALAALATACESPLPSSAEVEKMDVAAVEARVVQLQPGQPGAEVTYYVDGNKVSREQARALSSDQIVQVDVKGPAGAAGNTVTIHTTRGTAGETRAAANAAGISVTTQGPDNGAPVQVTTVGEGSGMVVAGADGFKGLLVIDGVVSDASALRTLRRDRIQQVDVIKGAAATSVYDDPRAAHGVIRITTSGGASNP